MPDPLPDITEGKFAALIDLLGRTGAEEFQVRYCEEEMPIVWIACARWGDIWQAAGALHPYQAMLRLAESIMDGGKCQHCKRPTAVDDKPPDPLLRLTDQAICWYRFDPELGTFRRACEGIVD
jgi:hypothetical protein